MTNQVSIQKCPCGHHCCNQYTLSNQGSVGFSKEDAILYAAAPELLEALKGLVNDGGPDFIRSSLWEAAKKAINKAEGNAQLLEKTK